MKKKGFTLTELIGVIILLGIIALIAVPVINSTLTNSKIKAYNVQVTTIKNAGKKWAVESTSSLPQGTDKCNISIAELVALGYIEDDKVLDPRDNTEMTGSIEISYKESSKTYYYDYIDVADTGIPNCVN